MHEHSTRKHTPKSLIRKHRAVHACSAGEEAPLSWRPSEFSHGRDMATRKVSQKRVCVSVYVSVCVCVCVLVWGVCVCNPTMRTESLRCCMQSLHPAVDYSFHVGQKTNLICATYAVTLCLRDRVKLCCISQTYFYLCFQVN